MNFKAIFDAVRNLAPKLITAVKASPSIAGKAIHEHKAIRRGVLLWVCYLVTHATLKVFQNPIAITTPEAMAYATVVGLLGVAIGFYNTARKQDPPA